MSEVKTNEVVETTEVVEVTEKVGVFTKLKDFGKKHKKGIIVAGLAIGAGIIGLIKLAKKSNECDEYEYELGEDEYVESDAADVEEAE